MGKIIAVANRRRSRQDDHVCESDLRAQKARAARAPRRLRPTGQQHLRHGRGQNCDAQLLRHADEHHPAVVLTVLGILLNTVMFVVASPPPGRNGLFFASVITGGVNSYLVMLLMGAWPCSPSTRTSAAPGGKRCCTPSPSPSSCSASAWPCWWPSLAT